MDDPSITIEDYIRLEEEKARRHGKVYNWETATYGKIWDNEDVHNLRSVETEFPAIVFNDTLTSEALLCEPTDLVKEIPYWWKIYKSGNLEVLESRNFKAGVQHNLAYKRNLKNLSSKYQGSFSF
ncbi:hypothetical protein Tco_0538007 [Tanacetum coccineum]